MCFFAMLQCSSAHSAISVFLESEFRKHIAESTYNILLWHKDRGPYALIAFINPAAPII